MHAATGRQLDVAQGQPRGTTGQPRWVAPTGTVTEYDFPTFGVVKNGVMLLNDPGKMVQQIWNEMPEHYSGIEMGEFIVMPDHIHGIIKINDPPTTNHVVGATQRGCPPCATCGCPYATCGCPYTTCGCPNAANDNPVSLPYLIDRLKTGTTNKYVDGVKTSNWKPFHKKLWQRNYYERIIRDEAEYARIAEYIRNNPILWEKVHTPQ
ncbi:MAG: hypothetical protein FWF67_02225 [Fibromonadales bacterium]|nr:hypothetical protein [Fibromonadales bacterium]